MNILHRVVMFANMDVLYTSRLNQGSEPKTSIDLLEKLYKVAFGLLNNLLKAMEFPHVSERSDGNWVKLWDAAHGCFEIMYDVATPVATIFFLIAIYKAVVSKPPEEQPKKFLEEALRYIFIIFIISNLFNFLTLITKSADDVTDAIMDVQTMNPSVGDPKTDAKYKVYDISYYGSPIEKTITKFSSTDKDSHKIKDYEKKKISEFFCDMFEYIILFFGGLGTIIVFGVAGYTIVMATIERVIKPLAMLPFSTIVVGMGACAGSGERTVAQFTKKLIGFSLSGVFIIMALKFGSVTANMKLFDINTALNLKEGSLMAAIAGILHVNLPVIMTTGLVKSSENFMDKMFA